MKKLPLPTPRALYQPNCPQKYTGPIEGADGGRPFNGHLWPTESWWIAHEPATRHHSSRFHFGYVHLASGVAEGGDYAVEGRLSAIKENSRRYSWTVEPDELPKRNNFPTRTAAIRTAAADLLRLARAARGWRAANSYDSLHDPARFAELVNWVRATVARETNSGEPRVMVAAPLPAPLPPSTGMPMLDMMIGAAA